MKKQYVLAMVATLGLVGCGGGGGGGSDDPGADDGQVRASELVGTWVQTNVNFADPYSHGEYEWVNTHRKTIVVQTSGSVLTFTNCVTGASLNANLADGVVTFPAVPGWDLDVISASTLTGTIVDDDSETDVELRKVSSNIRTTNVGVGVDVAVDLGGGQYPLSQLSQICAETVVDKYAANSVELRATGRISVSGLPVDGTVSLKFVSGEYFTDRYDVPYSYPSIDGSDVSGKYNVQIVGAGNLSNPDGIMDVSKNGSTGTEDMTFELFMYSAEENANIYIVGEFNLDAEWLAQPTP